MNTLHNPRGAVLSSLVAFLAACLAASAIAQYQPPMPAANCPSLDWTGGFPGLLKSTASFPTRDTINPKAPDCAFHQWSWEAFVWATAMVKDKASGTTLPRFLLLPTPADLLTGDPKAATEHFRPLKLAARSQHFRGENGYTEGAGAIVEADGNMLVAPNGYPVYASVHMNGSYFDTAQQNLIATGGYTSQPASSSFKVGAAVFKATWLRLDEGEEPPAGAYTTQAQVPVLQTVVSGGTTTIEPVPGQFKTVTVALVGLHVVGYTINHPEFLWGTFEHRLNSPATPDNSFSKSGSNANGYTFYKAGTSFADVNQPVTPPQLVLNAATQKLTPVTNVVLKNLTGGENQPGGSGNVAILNENAHEALAKIPAQAPFANYNLIGTVWMAPNSYNLNSNQADAIGSINLANTTAETFVQTANNSTPAKNTNCFLCHNPTSYSFQSPPPPQLANRLIALSHVLAVGTPYAVPNSISSPQSTLPKAIDATRSLMSTSAK